MEDAYQETLEQSTQNLRSLRCCLMLYDILNKYDKNTKKIIIDELREACERQSIALRRRTIDGDSYASNQVSECASECKLFCACYISDLSNEKQEIPLSDIRCSFEYVLRVKEVCDVFLRFLKM